MVNIYDVLLMHENPDDPSTTIVMRDGSFTVVKKETDEILDQWCNHHGSSLEGRRASARKVLQIRRRPPICVSEKWNLVLFPVPDENGQGLYWVNRKYVKIVKECGSKSTVITFSNGKITIVSVGRRSVMKHLKRCDEYTRRIDSPISDAEWMR